MASKRGRLVESLRFDGLDLEARILTWVEGVPLAAIEERPPTLLESLGSYLGRLDLALAELPAAECILDWDLAQLGRQADLVAAIEDDADRELAERALHRFLEQRPEWVERLPRSLIHHDANAMGSIANIGNHSHDSLLILSLPNPEFSDAHSLRPSALESRCR